MTNDLAIRILNGDILGTTEQTHEAVAMAVKALSTLPSVETEPVRHGRWETDGMPMDDGEYLMTRCTVCGTAYEYGHNENYCGYCGAKMDEVTSGD